MNALPANLASMLAMKKRDSDTYSTHSVASRGSERRKSSRFSFRRMFRRSSTRSVRLAKSASELETRSVSSIQTSGERDLALQSVSSEESSSSGRARQYMECPLCLARVSVWSSLSFFDAGLQNMVKYFYSSQKVCHVRIQTED